MCCGFPATSRGWSAGRERVPHPARLPRPRPVRLAHVGAVPRASPCPDVGGGGGRVLVGVRGGGGAERMAAVSAARPSVRVGQLWADRDKRSLGRLLRVVAIEEDKAVVQSPSGRGRKTRIRLDRFRPNSTGYLLMQAVDE